MPCCFNPRPGHVTGATIIPQAGRAGNESFNPRPGHVTGATLPDDEIAALLLRFNPRPGHVTGATVGGTALVYVSIRAPAT